MNALGFHIRNATFAFRESWTNLANGLLGFLLFPVFMFILAHMWQKFNGYLGNYTYKEMLAYIGVTEVLYMTFLRSGNVMQASGDFSISLARPRSWLATQGSALYGKTLGSRLVMTTLLFVLMLLFGISLADTLPVIIRLLSLLIPLGFMQVLYSLLFSSAQVRWEVTNYLVLPFGKLFLVFGGVFAPVSDFFGSSEIDLIKNCRRQICFFQPAYFVIKGSFYQMSTLEWILRILGQAAVLVLLNHWFFKNSRRHHQSFGG